MTFNFRLIMRVFEPTRAAYRKKIKQKKVCEFCNPKNIKEQECRSLSGEHWIVLVNKYPYMDGNIITVPRRHIENLIDLSEEEWSELRNIFIQIKKKLSSLFNTNDFNIGLNLGKKAGASISHLHWQIIPRNEKILNASNVFADLYVITMSPKELRKKIDQKQIN
jgi:ATP adenylyltransferase